MMTQMMTHRIVNSKSRGAPTPCRGAGPERDEGIPTSGTNFYNDQSKHFPPPSTIPCFSFSSLEKVVGVSILQTPLCKRPL